MIRIRKQQKQWTEPSADAASIRRLSQRLEVSEVIATLLWERDQRDTSIARDFLNPRLAGLDDPFALKNLRAVVSRIRKALERSESVVVYGDYDVDGVTSTVLLMHILSRFGVTPKAFVPHRLEEGYGLSTEALERVLESGKPDLLIAVDCGTNSREPVAFLRERGIDVIILDHHASKEALPEDCLLVNPHLQDTDKGEQPWTNLSAVGIVFKVVHGLLKELRAEGDDLAHEIQLKDFLDLVALGTICDLVPLIGENRILARHGLRLIQKGQRIGICALMEASGWRPGDEITPIDVSFRLGPRINASGRLADASGPIELLLSDDWQFARNSANELDAFNRERQAIEKEITATAIDMVETEFNDQLGLVLHHPDWHSGVVGIVASRIANRYHRPTLVLGAEGAEIKGSGRSIPGVNLVEVLQHCEAN
ncbi:MAG: single-stranded-DNA-specific exonuclease RecJ, partial [Opitutales bacterium]|nr:single-stranded-DNA-specific exonuclease RecJ [Opitutales bacterium]